MALRPIDAVEPVVEPVVEPIVEPVVKPAEEPVIELVEGSECSIEDSTRSQLVRLFGYMFTKQFVDSNEYLQANISAMSTISLDAILMVLSCTIIIDAILQSLCNRQPK